MRRRWSWSLLTSLALAATLFGGSWLYQSRTESELRRALGELRAAIVAYRAAQGRAPRSLPSLVESGVLATLPVDPTTGRRDTWIAIGEGSGEGIADVRSPCENLASDGRRYSDW
ncbi:MAG: hypothetical protein U0X73_16650 [Thermoanaerobaculia bacterium]